MAQMRMVTRKRRTGEPESGLVRLIDDSTGEYLHESEVGQTSTLLFAWVGLVAAAMVLEATTIALGGSWPYRRVPA